MCATWHIVDDISLLCMYSSISPLPPSPSSQIGVVKETRQYPKWTGSGGKEGEVGLDSGIMAAQLELNKLHKSLADEGFNQVLYYCM